VDLDDHPARRRAFGASRRRSAGGRAAAAGVGEHARARAAQAYRAPGTGLLTSRRPPSIGRPPGRPGEAPALGLRRPSDAHVEGLLARDGLGALDLEQPPLDLEAAGVPGQAPARADHAVAGDEDRDRVAADRPAHLARRRAAAERRGDRGVGGGAP
jgi:hypothetical protein